MNNLQKVMNKLEAWGQNAGLKFNSSKTEVFIFTKKRLKPEQRPPKLKVSNQPVEFSTTAKYWGFFFDQSLTWSTHLNNQINKGKRYLFTLKLAVIRNWGPKPKFIKWMIDAVFIKRCTYGILVWGHILRHPTKKAAVNRLNKLATSMITPVRTSTPLEGLQVIHNMMPIHLLAMYEALASLKHNSHTIELDWLGYSPTRKTYVGHFHYWQQIQIKLNLSKETTDKTNTLIWERNFKCDLNSLNHRGLPKQSQIKIYTDGSKTRNHAGACIAIIKHGNLRHTESIKLNPNVTIFQA